MPNYTTNYNLKKPLGTENYNVEDQNGNMDIIDIKLKEIQDSIPDEAPVSSVNEKTGSVVLNAADIKAADGTTLEEFKSDTVTHLAEKVSQTDYTKIVPYAVTTGTANTYAVTLNPAPTSLVEGMAITVKINVANTASSTININTLGAKTIKKANGNTLSSGNLKVGGVYTLRYDGINFILQGEGASGNATASDLLSGKTATTDAGEITGTIPSKSAQTYTPTTVDQTIAANQFISGVQTIKGDANLVASSIVSGKSIFGVAGSAQVKKSMFPVSLLNSDYNTLFSVGETALYVDDYNNGYWRKYDRVTKTLLASFQRYISYGTYDETIQMVTDNGIFKKKGVQDVNKINLYNENLTLLNTFSSFDYYNYKFLNSTEDLTAYIVKQNNNNYVHKFSSSGSLLNSKDFTIYACPIRKNKIAGLDSVNNQPVHLNTNDFTLTTMGSQNQKYMMISAIENEIF